MIDLTAARYAGDVQEVAISMIRHARKVIALPDGTECGTRFNSDEMTLRRLESMFSETEFIHEPLNTVEAALLDAAKSDYWYSNEKEYVFQEPEEDYEWESDAC